MTRKVLLQLVAALVLALALSSCKFDGAYDLPLPGGKAVSEGDAITVTAEFTDALNVVPRTAVMVDDVPVGQVAEVDRKGWHARVTLKIRKDLDLPANTVAEIRQTSLLGEKFVALLPPEKGAQGRLADGDNIPLARTGRNPEVEEVLGALSFVLSGGGVQQLRTISVEINKMLNGRTDDARAVLSRVSTLIGSLDQQKDSIITAMGAVDRLAVTLNKESRSVGAAIDALGPAVKVLSGQHAALVRMLRELDKLGTVGTRVVAASKDDVIATLRHLAGPLRELADAGNSLPRGVSLMASFPFPKEAAALAQGDYANALFAMDFDLATLLDTVDEVAGGGNLLPDLSGVLPTTPKASTAKPVNPLTTLLSGLLGGPPATKAPRSGSGPGSGGLLGGLAGLLGGGA